MIAFERQVDDFCILTRQVNQLYPKITRLLPDDAQNQKDSLDRQNEFLEVPFIFNFVTMLNQKPLSAIFCLLSKKSVVNFFSVFSVPSVAF